MNREVKRAQRRRTARILTAVTLVAAFLLLPFWGFLVVVGLVGYVALISQIAELYDRNQELLDENWRLNGEATTRRCRCDRANSVAGCTHGIGATR